MAGGEVEGYDGILRIRHAVCQKGSDLGQAFASQVDDST
jgi:hypothetical protein